MLVNIIMADAPTPAAALPHRLPADYLSEESTRQAVALSGTGSTPPAIREYWLDGVRGVLEPVEEVEFVALPPERRFADTSAEPWVLLRRTAVPS